MLIYGNKKQDGTREKKLVDGNYQIEVNVLAVNRFESILSCFERELFFIENGLPPRAVTIENHDRSYAQMLETVDFVEKRNIYERIC